MEKEEDTCNCDMNNVTGPSPRREAGKMVEFSINNTSVIIYPNQMVETESSATGIYTAEKNIDSMKVIESHTAAESELQNYHHCVTDFKITVETEECSNGRTCSKAGEQIESEKNSEENTGATKDVSRKGKEDKPFKDNTSCDITGIYSQTALKTDTDTCQDKEVTDGKTSAHSLDFRQCSATIVLSNAPLTHVDEEDGLMKTFGRLCGIHKRQQRSNYRTPLTAREDNSSELAGTQSADNDNGELLNVCAGSRFVHTNMKLHGFSTSKTDRQSSHSQKHDGHAKIQQKIVSPESQTMPSKPESVPAQRLKTSAVKPSTPEDVYDFTHGQRGYILLIVNEIFARQSQRVGAHWDLIKMREIARKFGFRSLNYNQDKNLTKAETIRLLKKAQNTDHSDCDCFMFMISTHGVEQRNALKGGQVDHALVCADEELIFTSSILDMFSDSNCPSLRGKPKLFYIQACRGEKLDSGGNIMVSVSVDKTDTGQLRDVRIRPESQDLSDTRPGADSWTNIPIVYRGSGTHSRVRGITSQQQGSSHHQSLSKYQQAVNHYQQLDKSQHWRATAQAFQQSRLYKPKVTTSYRVPEYSRKIPRVPSNVVNKIYSPTPCAIADAPSLKCHNDMMVMFAIPPGMFAWRNTSDGSWLIDYLHQVLMNYSMKQPKSFIKVMTKVSALMSRRTTHTPSSPDMHEKKAVSVIEHKLTKDILLQQKVPISDWIKKSYNIEF